MQNTPKMQPASFGTEYMQENPNILRQATGVVAKIAEPRRYYLRFEDTDDSPLKKEFQTWKWCSVDEIVAILNDPENGREVPLEPFDIIEHFAFLNGRDRNSDEVRAFACFMPDGQSHFEFSAGKIPTKLNGNFYIPAGWGVRLTKLLRQPSMSKAFRVQFDVVGGASGRRLAAILSDCTCRPLDMLVWSPFITAIEHCGECR